MTDDVEDSSKEKKIKKKKKRKEKEEEGKKKKGIRWELPIVWLIPNRGRIINCAY